jgi:L-ascorbate metabolism protein UlaG (beta-lactamase superfamily)
VVFANGLMKYEIKNGRFIVEGHRNVAGLADILKWQLSGKRQKWPRSIENRSHTAPPNRVLGKNLNVTWIGHSTVLIQTAGLNIVTDPFFSQRASPFQFLGPKRIRNPGIAIKDLPPIDLVLLSHNHYDHLDAPALATLKNIHNPKLITTLNNGGYVKNYPCTELDWRQSVEHGAVRITLMPALHWSKRSVSDTNKALWGAFVIETDGGALYFAADTGYGTGETFHEVKSKFGAPRLSLLPIGAYEPRWFMKPQHMNPQEAVQAHLDLDSAKSLAIHHGTVQLTDEAVNAPVVALEEAMAHHKIKNADFIVSEIGQSIQID